MPSALDAKIAQVAATTVCRFCSNPVPPEAVICECRVKRGEVPHTEWGADIKNFLATRAIERSMWKGCSEQSFWERMLINNYAGTVQGGGRNARTLTMSLSVVDAFPFAAGDAAAWIAAGCPTLFTI